MVKAFLKQSFRRRSNPIPVEDIVLNYVWINRAPFQPDISNKNAPLCGVPLECVDNVILNAKRYPQTKVMLWLDKSLLDDMSLFWVSSHIYNAGIKNVQIRDLAEIPSFRDNAVLFDWRRDISKLAEKKARTEDEKHNIWGRVDLARLLAVRHVLEEGAQYALYTDFDNQETFLDDPLMTQKLLRNQMVYGLTRDKRKIFENSYFAFGANILKTGFLNEMIDETILDVGKGENGYGAYYVHINHYTALSFLDYDGFELGFPAVAHPMGYKIPKPKEYQELGIN
ncbi:MAG: hypothetical protein ACK4VI_03970 [Alphaproteobacteria bacterium]